MSRSPRYRSPDRRYLAAMLVAVCASLCLFGCTDTRQPDANVVGDIGGIGDDDAHGAGDTDSATGDDTRLADTGPVERADTTLGDTGSADTGGDAADASDRDTASGDTGRGDAAADTTGHDTGPRDTGTDTGGAVCGNGTVESGESCDDGTITSNCDTYHDGGDGTCVPAGQCSDGYVLDSNGTCVEEQIDKHVHIYVTNTCKLSVDPKRVTVPQGRSISFVYHNHSSSYSVDVWLSYQGGFLDLQQGQTWDDQFVHCNTAGTPYTAYADITINRLSLRDPNCPGHRMKIECK